MWKSVHGSHSILLARLSLMVKGTQAMKEAWSNIFPLFVDDLFFSCELDARGTQQIRTQMYSQPMYVNDYYGREKYNVMIVFLQSNSTRSVFSSLKLQD